MFLSRPEADHDKEDPYMKLSFYGADQCVTGSCHSLEINDTRILIDCGL